MTERIGKSLLAREAILAALEARKRAEAPADGAAAFARTLGEARPADRAAETPAAPDLADALRRGLEEVDASVKRAGVLDEALVTGNVQDFHEVAVHLKQADLSFRFALEVRNRLIDAYREVMRMTV